MDFFNIDPGLALWTWITFGILFAIMAKFVFPSLAANLKEREKKIADSIDNAARIDQQLAQIEKEHKEIIQRSRNEADAILRKAREDAEQVRKSILQKAEKEARQVVEQARGRISEERIAALQSIRSELADFVCTTAEKVVDRSFVAEEDREWVRELVKQI